MNYITALLVEDEVKSMNNLKNLITENCPQVEIIGEAGSIKAAFSLFENKNFKPDIAFLDINLPDGTIFQLLNELRPIDFEIIFVTAHQEYAIKACQYSSIGYILKPIDPEELRETVNRIDIKADTQIDKRLEVFQSHYVNNPNAFRKMSISAMDGTYFVNIQEIVRFEAEDNYTHIFLNNGERITASKTIKAYEDLLEPYNFYRVHKRHIINLNHMRKFVKGDGGYLIMDDGIKIEVSRRRRPSFMERLRRLQEGMGE